MRIRKIDTDKIKAQLIFTIGCALIFTIASIVVVLIADTFVDYEGPNEEILISLIAISILFTVYLIIQGPSVSVFKSVLNPTHWKRHFNPCTLWGILGLLAMGVAMGALIEFLPTYESMAASVSEVYENETMTTKILGCTIQPFLEELVFRGVLFGGLLKRGSFWSAALIS